MMRKRTDDATTYDNTMQAIACGDAVDAGNTTTADVFREIIYTASNVSQLFGPVWDFSYYCHKCAIPCYSLLIRLLIPTVLR